MNTTVRFNGNADDVNRVLMAIPGILNGTTNVPDSVTAELKSRVGERLLELIREDFLTKTGGGIGKDGVSWHVPADSPPEESDAHGEMLATLRAKGVRNADALARRFSESGGFLEDSDELPPEAIAVYESFENPRISHATRMGIEIEPDAKDFAAFNADFPCWPMSGTLPDTWMDDLSEEATDGITEMITTLLQSGWRP